MCMREGIPSLHMSQIVLITFFKCTLVKIAPLKSAGTKDLFSSKFTHDFKVALVSFCTPLVLHNLKGRNQQKQR